MIVTDHNGERWATVKDAARLARIRPDLIWQWRKRGRIRAHRTGNQLWVNMGDVHHCEAEWRTRGRHTGTRKRGDVDNPPR